MYIKIYENSLKSLFKIPEGHLIEMSTISIGNLRLNFHKTFQNTSFRYTCRYPLCYLETNHEESGKSGKYDGLKVRVTSRLWIAFILQIFQIKRRFVLYRITV